ncbi:hypothetical protein DMC30DRAFT_244056 [Rhodotorula diobovata]|uniref:Uncharacterized protein n=1 Tax=Rhodotorula diobovata TaxID=5288 RepID=A0A5C5FWT9_9BASI|nr:hypothetical protein DMC30DRAFT_244056 [Rhodotorula diobovata]
MIYVFLLAALAFTLVRCAPLPAGTNGLAATVAVNSAASAAVAEVSHKELCYLEFLLETAVQFAKDQVIKDTDGRNVFLNDGFKSDSTGREVYYVSYCYASSSVKGSTSESKMGDSTTLSNPFADIIDGLGIQSNVGFGGRGGLLASLVGGSGGGTASGLLRKRQLFNGLGACALTVTSLRPHVLGSARRRTRRLLLRLLVPPRRQLLRVIPRRLPHRQLAQLASLVLPSRRAQWRLPDR